MDVLGKYLYAISLGLGWVLRSGITDSEDMHILELHSAKIPTRKFAWISPLAGSLVLISL